METDDMALFMYDDWAIGDEDYLHCEDCEDRELYYTNKMAAIQEQLIPLFRHLRKLQDLSEEEIDELIDSLTDECEFKRPDWAKFERQGETK